MSLGFAIVENSCFAHESSTTVNSNLSWKQ